MSVEYKKTLFIFRRDLRLEDNIGLIFALKSSEAVIPAFIFTPEQIERNAYRSEHCLRFMIESLEDLNDQLKEKGSKLYFFEGSPDGVVEKCIKKLNIDAVVVNRDYTPYSQQRDKKLAKECKAGKIDFCSFDDLLLQRPEDTVKSDGKPYSVFTPYFRNASKAKVKEPEKNRHTNYFKGSIPFSEGISLLSKLCPKEKGSLVGGRSAALKILRKLGDFSKYGKLRDFPAEDYSTHLSPYLKFNVCSVREVYKAVCEHLSKSHDLIRSLYWRDFFSCVAFFFPHVFKGAFHKKYDKLNWSYSKGDFAKWCEGKTGFPIVDAGMREMNETGFMHNRVRMIVGSFLVKDLHIDWRLGEKYFAQMLVDYDPAVNNGNWQWVASTGCDAQPYFRIFNPWSQQEKFDPDCVYIKKWIPELKGLTSKEIHKWYDEKYRTDKVKYPEPMIEHSEEAKKALKAYKAI